MTLNFNNSLTLEPNISVGSKAKIILDSISPLGNRLTTFEVIFARFILPEFNTHRSLCLSGDSLIHFDHKDYVAVGKNNTKLFSLKTLYTLWKNKAGRASLDSYLLKNVNENNRSIQHCGIKDVFYSGKKHLFKITTRKGKSIECSAQHRLLTDSGWQSLASLNAYVIPSTNVVHLPKKVCLTTISGNKVSFDAIVSIEYLGKKDCYDIEVDSEFHNFIADGICCHNSKNSASSRARPMWKTLLEVIENPVIPNFQKNQSGMQSSVYLNKDEMQLAIQEWLIARDNAVIQAVKLSPRENKSKSEIEAWAKIDSHTGIKYTNSYSLDIHKQWVNRLVEPFMWHTVIVSGTDWDNFFNLRVHAAAQDEIKSVAYSMLSAYKDSNPTQLSLGEWHIPYLKDTDNDLSTENKLKCSVARCARVSYLTHDGKLDRDKDIILHDRLAKDGHWSAFEHAAECANHSNYVGNFKGWNQYRKSFQNECFRDTDLGNLYGQFTTS